MSIAAVGDGFGEMGSPFNSRTSRPLERSTHLQHLIY